MKCSPLRDQRICCLAVILRCRSLWTALSVCAVEIGSPERGAAADNRIQLPGVEQFDAKSAEIRQFLRGELDQGRTRELMEEMRTAGLPT